ncbi:DNA methyltransferase [Mycobacterium alsense]|uniref:site-specific DNA-methyltransferase n=1 Tax=Mycobacterium alsense TaxID=324058 RepID=UPI0007FF76C0|nr:DNA methyltransferase [Mycobacterium alsense]OBI95753.1 DNA methyltransferase [Mycobacterium alsense]
MSRLNDLIRQVNEKDPSLAADLQREVAALADRRAFGLNFERHVPEAVELPGRRVRRGDKVRILPARGQTPKKSDEKLWRVASIERDGDSRTAELVALADDTETATAVLEDLVVVAEFRDPIYPGLVSTGKIERGGDKPYHTLINAENFYALQLLMFTHRGKVDCIYIDPPYNTGARDWKYNNDYVEADDHYRHSKWLAFMERRLVLAKELLNPDDSVLIVTIDEKEYLRLGLLLEQTFPEARVTMVASSINAAGATRKGTFARSAEYLYFVQFGSSRPVALPLGDEWNPVRTKNKQDIYWSRLIRSGADSLREDSPNQFYPVFVRNSADGPVFEAVGAAAIGIDRGDVVTPDGCVALWPIRKDGKEGRWRVGPVVLRGLIAAGHARLGGWRDGSTTVYYLKQGEAKKVTDGTFPILGHRPDGSVVTDASDYQPRFVPTDLWRITSHDAGNSGTRLLDHLLPGRKFPFPKALYAVEDAMRFFLADKPGATVLDYFSGSGTTAHAVMRLNREDGGHRQCISVTNNEVSAEEQTRLRKDGLRPGDAAWEELGICDYITKPRIMSAVTGLKPDGEPVRGDYRFGEAFPMSDGFEENAEFFTLTYEAPLRVASNREFERIAPLLWMRAGSKGSRIDDITKGWDVAETYGVIADFDHTDEFLKALVDQPAATHAVVITDEDWLFESVCRDLPEHIEPVRLYEAYLRNFEIEAGRGAR